MVEFKENRWRVERVPSQVSERRLYDLYFRSIGMNTMTHRWNAGKIAKLLERKRQPRILRICST